MTGFSDNVSRVLFQGMIEAPELIGDLPEGAVFGRGVIRDAG